MTASDDALVEALAYGEAELRERVLSLEADVESYRLLAQQAIHALHDVISERDRLRHQLHMLRLHRVDRELAA